jgi:hypothetical protein
MMAKFKSSGTAAVDLYSGCFTVKVWDGEEKDYLYFHPDAKRKG